MKWCSPICNLFGTPFTLPSFILQPFVLSLTLYTILFEDTLNSITMFHLDKTTVLLFAISNFTDSLPFFLHWFAVFSFGLENVPLRRIDVSNRDLLFRKNERVQCRPEPNFRWPNLEFPAGSPTTPPTSAILWPRSYSLRNSKGIQKGASKEEGNSFHFKGIQSSLFSSPAESIANPTVIHLSFISFPFIKPSNGFT